MPQRRLGRLGAGTARLAVINGGGSYTGAIPTTVGTKAVAVATKVVTPAVATPVVTPTQIVPPPVSAPVVQAPVKLAPIVTPAPAITPAAPLPVVPTITLPNLPAPLPIVIPKTLPVIGAPAAPAVVAPIIPAPALSSPAGYSGISYKQIVSSIQHLPGTYAAQAVNYATGLNIGGGSYLGYGAGYAALLSAIIPSAPASSAAGQLSSQIGEAGGILTAINTILNTVGWSNPYTAVLAVVADIAEALANVIGNTHPAGHDQFVLIKPNGQGVMPDNETLNAGDARTTAWMNSYVQAFGAVITQLVNHGFTFSNPAQVIEIRDDGVSPAQLHTNVVPMTAAQQAQYNLPGGYVGAANWNDRDPSQYVSLGAPGNLQQVVKLWLQWMVQNKYIAPPIVQPIVTPQPLPPVNTPSAVTPPPVITPVSPPAATIPPPAPPPVSTSPKPPPVITPTAPAGSAPINVPFPTLYRRRKRIMPVGQYGGYYGGGYGSFSPGGYGNFYGGGSGYSYGGGYGSSYAGTGATTSGTGYQGGYGGYGLYGLLGAAGAAAGAVLGPIITGSGQYQPTPAYNIAYANRKARIAAIQRARAAAYQRRVAALQARRQRIAAYRAKVIAARRARAYSLRLQRLRRRAG